MEYIIELGRYGDPIDPIGDLKAMNNTMKLLKPGGILFLSVPIGPDVIVFNLQRRYGQFYTSYFIIFI